MQRAATQQSGELESVAALPGEPRNVSAAGVTRTEQRLTTLENDSPFDTSAGTRRRLVVIADNDRAARATLAAIRWFKTAAPRALRDRWAISAALISNVTDATPAQRLEFPPANGFFDHPEQPESRYLWRWATYQAPDVLLQVRGGDVLSRSSPPAGSLSAAMAGGSEIGAVQAIFGSARETDGPALLEHVLNDAAGTRESEVHATLRSRASREPLAIARVLAGKYPQNPLVSYIPSMSWAGTLRLAAITKDNALRQKVLNETRPWLSRERPLFGERVALTAVAGTLIYADLARLGEESARSLAMQGADEALKVAPTGYAQHGAGWTDDMFMLAAILSRTGRMPGRERDLDHLASMLLSYARRLQREDGVFVHFTDGRIPWGRGNGFASLGITEALTALPANHQARAPLVEIYRRHMNGMKAMQAPDGMWRQVVDEPGAYREESVTAMTLSALARGIRLGWVDSRIYKPVVDRAWRALAAHITGDGAIVDICTSTGSQATLRQYLDRAAISGFDDRGGAMALLAALEMHELH
jgi:unsaturated rhamnogalacturonyl hydrolase